MFFSSNNGLNSCITINGNTVTINGKKYCRVKEIIIKDLDDLESEIGKFSDATIEIEGNTQTIKTVSANVVVKGTVTGDVKTTSGSVECGNVYGSVNTMSGSVDAQDVTGNVKTMSGSVRYKK